MYVTRDKSEAVVFAFSTNSDHWNNLVPRLPLQGLLPEVEYELTEPTPNDIKRAAGNYMMIESDGKSAAFEIIYFYLSFPLVPVYQLGVGSVVLTGEILMSGGLPIRFYTLDDAVVFCLKRVN
jgi:hypothetical protein